MNQVGAMIRAQRLKLGLLQQDVAAKLDMDAPMLSKIEKGLRQIKREQLFQLSAILKLNEADLQTLWIADQIFSVIKDEKHANEAIQLVDKKINRTSKK